MGKTILGLYFTISDLSVQRIEPIGYDAKRNAYWLIGGACYVLVSAPRS